MMRSCAIAAFALGLAMPLAAAEPAQDIAARTELHAIQTLTLSDKQFLTGDAEAKVTTVSGQRASSTPSASRPSRSTASPAAG